MPPGNFPLAQDSGTETYRHVARSACGHGRPRWARRGFGRADVDWQAGMLVVRQSKFRKSAAWCPFMPRPWPDSSSTKMSGSGCIRHQGPRRSLCPRAGCDCLMVLSGALSGICVTGSGSPRLRFEEATDTRPAAPFCREYPHPVVSEGAEVERRLPELSTYLGHGCTRAHLLVSYRCPGITAFGHRAPGTERTGP